jgi:hypothetical protein
MQEYLQHLYGLPVVLKNVSERTVHCPYCNCIHEVGGKGYSEARCIQLPQTIGINGRVFHPNYGLHVFEFEFSHGQFHLTTPDYLPALDFALP